MKTKDTKKEKKRWTAVQRRAKRIKDNKPREKKRLDIQLKARREFLEAQLKAKTTREENRKKLIEKGVLNADGSQKPAKPKPKKEEAAPVAEAPAAEAPQA